MSARCCYYEVALCLATNQTGIEMQRNSDIKTDVLVVGAGLAGAATAYFLAKEGIDVLVVDKFGLNTQASGSNAGSIHIQIPHHEFTTEGCSWVRGFAPIIPVLLDAGEIVGPNRRRNQVRP